ncbi:glycosyltransferase family 2 protein [Aeromicrobium sp. UC242_57]|uniref:glycosyltransferase family 2 protein n=1 Tax=Aeromicrobium sp. UC242_57 TaxID=3374624 RepID=UPI003787349A
MTHTPWDVAVIVPFLNAEATLAEAVDSLVGQTAFERMHVILVDNSSTDGSPAIAAAYAAAHPNIEVTHRVGGGCGGARNAGLPLAVEPYVTFLDADDLLLPESVEQRLALATSTGSDVVLGAMETFPVVRPYTPVDLYAHDRVVEGVAEDRRLVHTANVSAILFRRDFFDDPANQFLEDMPFEDVSVTTAALVLARRIAVSSYVGYRYRKDPAAATIMSTAHSRPGNYRDHLTINALVHDRHRHDPSPRKPSVTC